MTSSILITGGTGTLGRHTLPLVQDAGFSVRVLSRQAASVRNGTEYVTGDLFKGEGIEPALAGIDTVLHLAGGAKGDDVATRNLAEAAARAGVRHLVHISVIGVDRVPLAWFKMKQDAERAVTESGVPWTMLRAAQFHDLALTVVRAMTKFPVVPVPGGLRWQPVDARDVAARLAELTLGEPAELVPDLAGPDVFEMGELIRSYLGAVAAARGGKRARKVFLPVRMPGKVGRAYRAGDNLALGGASEGVTEGARTWEEFLAERVGEQAVQAV
ncbi:NAD(P)H-binding protein [Solihabitans fulvus]|uniref:NAD(P)H-binding protein n=1 Tax=Solihabitans fulvus TaxID=1892852 RepID=A0A5B2XT05_9PSEU|nr:NAD(P)H-binding protein [Solihabitans fulvus]KAA2266072.1 NAD(P)H-binding protein [Solihabitans fulvus]